MHIEFLVQSLVHNLNERQHIAFQRMVIYIWAVKFWEVLVHMADTDGVGSAKNSHATDSGLLARRANTNSNIFVKGRVISI